VREPIVLLDAQQRVMMHNTAFSELHGIEDDDAVGVPLAEVGNGVWRDSDTLQRLNDVVTRNRDRRLRRRRGVDRHRTG